MFSQYFGHYLLSKGLIRPEQLADALEYQRSAHLKLGVIAINEGFMTPAQVELVHNLQKKVDKRFGELAIELGYIDEDQLNTMLNTQKQGHLMLGQALADRGYFTLEQLQEALENYKKDSGISNRQYNVIVKNDTQEIEKIFLGFGEYRMSKPYSDYTTLLIRNIIRFVDDNPAIEINPVKAVIRSDWYACQEIMGKINFNTAISCDEAAFVKLAAKFSGEDMTGPDELAQASVGEFLNLHNGIFLVNMSNNDIELELRPQEVLKDFTIRVSNELYAVTCSMPWGKFDVILG